MSPRTAHQTTADVELKPVSPTQASTKRSTGGDAPRSVSNQTSPKQPQASSNSPAQSQMKKLSRKSSKPIINWFQRKLAGSEIICSSVPPLPLIQQNKKGGKNTQGKKLDPVVVPKRNTISLDGSDDYNSYTDRHTVDSFDDHRGRMPANRYGRRSISCTPSPSPSHSSSSYLSDPRTFASMAASTKPTTLLSVDLAGGGMAHIAQAPPTPTLAAHRLGPHIRANSTTPSTVGSITFSTLPVNAPSRPSPTGPGNQSRAPLQHGTLNAPQHTTHHPRYNPRPSSPPPDDASVLTLASSAFGIPGSRVGANALNGRRSVADDSFSHFSGAHGLGDSVSHFTPGDLDGDDDRMEADREGDVDASVRALRPRSSRRGSWESEASGWSAHLGTGGPGTPSILRERSLWTTPSLRTGTRSVNLATEEESLEKSSFAHDDRDDRSLAFTTFTTSEAFPETDEFEDRASENFPDEEALNDHEPPTPSHGASQDTERPQSPTLSSVNENGGPGAATPKRDKGQETPKVSNLTLEDTPPPVPSIQDTATKEKEVVTIDNS
ncbi:hypothetical protein BC629DRAFT_1595740 [Irpex lacteus]|nr:hypothetical protein BC629DRAFT_1595740 [Irpex lacteus]